MLFYLIKLYFQQEFNIKEKFIQQMHFFIKMIYYLKNGDSRKD
jgi:hypothetical protein